MHKKPTYLKQERKKLMEFNQVLISVVLTIMKSLN